MTYSQPPSCFTQCILTIILSHTVSDNKNREKKKKKGGQKSAQINGTRMRQNFNLELDFLLKLSETVRSVIRSCSLWLVLIQIPISHRFFKIVVYHLSSVFLLFTRVLPGEWLQCPQVFVQERKIEIFIERASKKIWREVRLQKPHPWLCDRYIKTHNRHIW